MNRLLFIVNPSSGGREARDVSNRLEEHLTNLGVSIYRYETTGNDDFKQVTTNYLSDGYGLVYIFGGDGTVSEYISSVSSLKDRPNIVVIPLGTTNNLARALNTEMDINQLISKLTKFDFTETKVDVGKINENYFISTLSAGSIPEVAWETDDYLKELIGPLAYILEGLTALNEGKTYDLELEIDSEKLVLNDVILLIISLSNSVFGIPAFFENARINDGKFHFYALKNSDFLQMTKSLATTLSASSVANDEIAIRRSFKKAKLSSSMIMNLALDGEKGPEFPVELEILEKHFTFLVPEAKNKKTL